MNANIISLADWLAQVGITATTAWRWRQRGWLTVTNIAGKNYVTAEDADIDQQAATEAKVLQAITKEILSKAKTAVA